MPITVQVKQISPYTTEGIVREHHVLVDRPESKGGTDRGAMGGELFLVALGGCFMSTLLEIVRTREANISDITINIAGELEGTPKRYTSIEMQISANYDDAEQMEKFVTMAERGCIVANSISGAIDLKLSIMESV
jgi:putative redox protein